MVARWLALVAALGLGRGFAEPLDRILAIVNGHVIMLSDVRAFRDLGLAGDRAVQGAEQATVTYLVERRLMLEEVNRFVVDEPDPSRVERRLEQLRTALDGAVDLEQVLARSGLTIEDLRQVLADEERREAYLARRFAMVDETRRASAMSAWVDGLRSRADIRRSAQ